MLYHSRRTFLSAALVFLAAAPSWAAEPRLELRPNDRIALVGNSLAERMRLYGNFETLLHLRFPQHELSIRNFAWPCDEVAIQQRPNDYTVLDDPLEVFKPNVFLCFYGANESFKGPDGVAEFEEQYRQYLARLRERFGEGGASPRIALVTPIAFEPTGDPHQPKGTTENRNLKLYADAVMRVAAEEKLPAVDLFKWTLDAFTAKPGAQYTINGLHINDAGDDLVANWLDQRLFGNAKVEGSRYKKLREVVKDLQWIHHQDYRMVNGWYVYGSRSKPLDVDTFRPEYAKLRKMCAERDRAAWAIAQGKEPPAIDDAEPPLADPPTAFGTKTYSEPEELRYLSPAEAEAAMTVAPDYRIQTFASEEDFPDLAKPVQMAFDNRGRLWVACMPSYPQWRPSEGKPNDKLLILEDTNGDGKADKCTTFADQLHVPVGFEFWNGGVLVVSQPKLLFLKDTDGDDRADVREVVLDGFSSDDTHHAISAFEWTPDGKLLMLEGIAMSDVVETPWGPVRNKDRSLCWALDPRSWRLDKHITPCFANPWCYTHNDWGQGFVGDGTGAQQHWATPLNGAQFDQRTGNSQFIADYGPVMRPAFGNGFIFSRHFPDDAQGNFFFACVINMNGILQFKVEDKGSGYLGTRIEDLLTSTDRNFRPGDPQIGPDGALYFVDWHNPLIGHMQYSQRDPNRDHTHGRVYRLYAPERPLVTPVAQAGRSIPELLEQLREFEAQTRYRVQRELRDRPTAEVVDAVKAWTGSIAASDPQHDHLLTEALYTLSGHHVVDRDLLARVLQAKNPNARAAAVHTIADRRDVLADGVALIAPLVADAHPRVRLEAVRALSFFPEPRSMQVALTALGHPLDDELNYTLESTIGALRPVWTEAREHGTDLASGDPVGAAFLERVAAGNDRGREVAALLKAIIERYDQPGARTTLTARLDGLDGNVEEGGKVFKRACQACHKVGDQGADFGPNLSDVGKRLRRDEILESMLFPNIKIEPKYRATNIVTVEGKAFSGLVVGDTDKELSLLLGTGAVEKIAKEDVDVRQEVEVSSMPDKMHEAMSGTEFIDLLDYLAEQQTPPPAAPVAPAASGGE